MSPQSSNPSPIRKAFNSTALSLKNNPLLFVPFLIFFIFESLALILVYLAPRQPLILVLGPPIRTFWGEKFLHYPLNFILLPKLAANSRMALSVFLGSLLTGMAIAIILDIYHKKHSKLSSAFVSAIKKYIYLFIIILITTALFYFLGKAILLILSKYFLAGHTRLLFLKADLWLGPILIGLNFIMAVFIQSALVYAIPVVMAENKRLTKALIKSMLLFKRFFIPTLILVGMPMLLYIPIIILNYNTYFLIFKLFPEAVLWVAFLGTIISSLIIDPVVTIATTFFYLSNKESANL